jgi:hypothetical protein
MMPKLDAFTAAFIEAALWSTTGDDDEPLDNNYSASDIDPATLAAMERECADFQEKYGDLIEDDDSPAIDKWGRDEMAGHEFWLTMNGHGAGFGDGNFPKHDDELYEAAKTYRGFDLYVGDDGVIYASGHEPPLPVSEVRRPILRPRPAVRSAHRVRSTPRPHYAGESDRPEANIYWRDIPRGSTVKIVGHSYIVTKPDGTQASAYWSGQDATVAQHTLDSMAKASAKGQRLPLPKPRGFNSALRRKR